MIIDIEPSVPIQQVEKLLAACQMQVFECFKSQESRFVLKLILADPNVNSDRLDLQAIVEHPAFHWEVLEDMGPVLPYCYIYLQPFLEQLSPPESLLAQGETAYYNNVAANIFRMQMMENLTQQLFIERGIPFLWMKGAVELLLFKDVPHYLGLRAMGDIDLLCLPEDLERIDSHLMEQGFVFGEKGAPFEPEEYRRFTLRNSAHYRYNIGTPTAIECHIELNSELFTDAYPHKLAQEMIENCRTVQLDGTTYLIPRLEHFMVQFFYHTAHLYDNHMLVLRPRMRCESDLEDDQELIQRRIDSYVLLYLIRLTHLLKALDGITLDWNEVNDYCNPETLKSPYLRMYLDAAAIFLARIFPLPSAKTMLEALGGHQKHLVLAALQMKIQSATARSGI